MQQLVLFFHTLPVFKISLLNFFLLIRLLFVIILSFISIFFFTAGFNEKAQVHKISSEKIQTGAEQTDKYLPYLKGKRVAILANQTTIIGKTHLVDSLKKWVSLSKVFGPEHGFRGNASAGIVVTDETDAATGIPIVAL